MHLSTPRNVRVRLDGRTLKHRVAKSFLVVRDTLGNVRFDVHGVSHPALPFARALSPIADRLQDRAVRRYLAAMRHAVSSA